MSESFASDDLNVLVVSGIHRGEFPIRGMTIGECRDGLSHLIGVKKTAVAVIDGEQAGDNTVIGDEVTQLTFVEPSAVKG